MLDLYGNHVNYASTSNTPFIRNMQRWKDDRRVREQVNSGTFRVVDREYDLHVYKMSLVTGPKKFGHKKNVSTPLNLPSSSTTSDLQPFSDLDLDAIVREFGREF